MINSQQYSPNDQDISELGAKMAAEVSQQTGFQPAEMIGQSDYHGSGRLRTVYYRGSYQGESAVLKISRRNKSELSEAEMIRKFKQQNQSELIRPPKTMTAISWDKEGYEALIMELVVGDKVLDSGQLQTSETVEKFFQVYREYKNHCIQQPWLELQNEKSDWQHSFENLVELSQKVKPTCKLRQAGDRQLAENGYELLKDIWADVDWQFMHGHLSVEDLVQREQDIILLRNQFWQWKQPFYDAVFGYHWFMYTLGRVEGITAEQVAEQRNLWLEQIYALAENEQEHKLIKAALLERAIAGLLVDGLAYLDEEKEITAYLIEATRRQVEKIISELV